MLMRPVAVAVAVKVKNLNRYFTHIRYFKKVMSPRKKSNLSIHKCSVASKT